MSRYRLDLQYDGGFYRGFQRLTYDPPPRGNPRLWPPRATVQEELEVKLSLLLRREVGVLGSGRTDRGVHASHQVVALEFLPGESADSTLVRLEKILHPSLRLLGWRPVAQDFHPRHCARVRTYHYYLWPQAPSNHPFLERFCWLYPEALDLEAMRQAALPLLGVHDFSAYCRSPETGENRVRHLRQLDIFSGTLTSSLPHGPWLDLSQLLCFQVCANAFLRRMVRQLVANLVQVGSGQWPGSRLWEILQTRDPGLSAPPAPAQGLFLVRVDYQ